MIIAKVILIGNMLNFSRRFENKPLIVLVIYRSILFSVFVLLFGVLEHFVEGWFHRKGLLGGLQTIRDLGAYELGARVLMMAVSFVPFFVFWEIALVLDPHKLMTMFF